MADKIEYSRLLLKRTNLAGIEPTVTTATTLNALVETDLLDGEMFLNTSDKRAFVRMNSDIYEFDLVASGTTDFDFCATGLQTSAISGCSPVEIWDDFNFQSQRNITTSNGTGKIELDESGNADMMKFGISGASQQDFLQIDPNFNGLFGTSLTSYDSDFDRFSQFYCDPNNTLQVTTDNNNTYNTGIQSGYNAFTQRATTSLASSNLGGIATAEIVTTVNLGPDTSQIDLTADVINIDNISFDGGTTKWVFKELEIGDWNMDATVSVQINHGLSATEWKTVRNIGGIIRRDDDAGYFPLGLTGINTTNPPDAGIQVVNSTQIFITRFGGGGYDNTDFDSTGFNRGWVTFWYKPD